ncbi:hypothetical protein BpHYR1_024251 [Brachionus plicatilis]|uniref:Uncharacterized protein n=1 Tax=Brachionus plicatilis TaxID=10195 RepID=A0A3M7RTN7_BRAPC|nr:hypothetical protein BpHYR1_024251 [Brachionus plicatilis]
MPSKGLAILEYYLSSTTQKLIKKLKFKIEICLNSSIIIVYVQLFNLDFLTNLVFKLIWLAQFLTKRFSENFQNADIKKE